MRLPIKLMINGSLLRKLITEKTTIALISEELKTSRQTVHSWFSSGRISPMHLSKVVQILGLSGDEVNALDRSRITIEERLILKNKVYKKTLEQIRDQIDSLLNRME